MNEKKLSQALNGLLVAVVVFMPTQLGWQVMGAHITLADFLVAAALIVWIIRIIFGHGSGATLDKAPPLAVITLLIFAVMSLSRATDLTGALIELGQFVEYFIVVYLLFANNIRTRQAFQRIVLTLLGISTAVVGIGVVHYITISGVIEPMEVRSTFTNMHTFGGYMAIILPAMWGVAICSRKLSYWVWICVTVLAGILVTLSGGAFIALLAGILVVSMVRSQKLFLFVVAALVAMGMFLFPHLPRKNAEVLWKTIEPYRKDSSADTTNVWPDRYVQWIAGINLVRARPLHGTGMGSYSREIGAGYGTLPRASEGSEAYDTQNLYVVWAVEMGLPALLALLWLLLAFARHSAAVYGIIEETLERGLALGVLGSVVAFFIGSFFIMLPVRGIGMGFVILLALVSVAGGLQEGEEEIGETPVEELIEDIGEMFTRPPGIEAPEISEE